MERLVWLYAVPVDPRLPVVGFDERPCFVIGNTVSALTLKAGSVMTAQYEDAKVGSCVLLVAIEPKTGTRFVRIEDHRRTREDALLLRAWAAQYPLATQSRLVQANRNTHHLRALDETFPAADACALSQRCALYQTPTKARWVNLIEIEVSAIVRPCLARRSATKADLERAVMALVNQREAQAITIDGQCSIEAARTKLKRHSAAVLAENSTYRTT